MMTVDSVYSRELEYQEEAALFLASASLFPTLSFAPSEAKSKQPQGIREGIVEIKGTLSVSF
jgi:predicted SPOUT superfamily RNA methylase MTH1